MVACPRGGHVDLYPGNRQEYCIVNMLFVLGLNLYKVGVKWCDRGYKRLSTRGYG